MEKGLERIEQALDEALRQNALRFGDILSLERDVDFFYISDINTHEMYFLSTVGSGRLPKCWRDWQGKKCYELLQGRQSPCPFCNNAQLKRDRYAAWQHDNPVLGRTVLLRDRLVDTGGLEARLEVAIDLSDAERTRQIVLDYVEQQGNLMHFLRLLADADSFACAFDDILPALCDYFDAEASFIHSKTQMEMRKSYVRTASGEPLLFHLAANKPLEMWRSLLGDGEQVLVRLSAETAEDENWALLAQNGLDTLSLTPIFARGELIGVVGLYNLHKHFEAFFMLKMLSAVLASAIQKKALQEEVLQVQYIDPVTGRLNFEGYKLEVERILREHPRRKYALWYCDLKKFKFINDVYGYDVGDRLLQYWSALLAQSMQEGETFGRVSGDNFSALRRYENVDELEKIFAFIAESLANYEELAQKKFCVEVVSGVYLIEKPEDVLGIGEMLNKANMAQKSVKGCSGSHLAIYNAEMRRKEIQAIELTAEMREALKNEEFVLYFQPQVDIQHPEGGWNRAEALVRWQRSDKRLMMPGQFIDLFEQNGMIVELDYYMMEHVCRYIADLEDDRREGLCLSVNVSRVTMLQAGFADDYAEFKRRYGVPDNCIELEFTESVAVDDVERFVWLIKRLKREGFLCAMDDFGTGQSSLNILQRLPLDVLKMDRQFFDGAQNGRRNRIVVSCVLKMARMLKMKTVAEGIELESQVKILREMGCDYIQGYVFSKPLPAEYFRLRLAGEDA